MVCNKLVYHLSCFVFLFHFMLFSGCEFKSKSQPSFSQKSKEEKFESNQKAKTLSSKGDISRNISKDLNLLDAGEAAANLTDFEKLHLLAHYSTVLMNQQLDAKLAKKKSPRILVCDPDFEKISIFSMQIKSRIDDLEIKQSVSYIHFLNQQAEVLIERCQSACSCQVWIDFLEKNQKQFSPQQVEVLKTDLSLQQSKMDSSLELKCIDRLKDFCLSPLSKEVFETIR